MAGYSTSSELSDSSSTTSSELESSSSDESSLLSELSSDSSSSSSSSNSNSNSSHHSSRGKSDSSVVHSQRRHTHSSKRRGKKSVESERQDTVDEDSSFLGDDKIEGADGVVVGSESSENECGSAFASSSDTDPGGERLRAAMVEARLRRQRRRAKRRRKNSGADGPVINLNDFAWQLSLAIRSFVVNRPAPPDLGGSADVRGDFTDDAYQARLHSKISHTPSFAHGGLEMQMLVVDICEYAPTVLAYVRNSYCEVSDRDFANAWVPDSSSTNGSASAGRSGATFFISTDKRFVAKTISRAESKAIRRMLPSYQRHLRAYPESMLNRILMHFRLGKQYVVCLSNSLPVHEISTQGPLVVYDLKGSLIARESRADDGVAKDTNFLCATRGHHHSEQVKLKYGQQDANSSLCIKLESDVRERLLAIVRQDADFLASNSIMDYSLLVGVAEVPWDNGAVGELSASGTLPPKDSVLSKPVRVRSPRGSRQVVFVEPHVVTRSRSLRLRSTSSSKIEESVSPTDEGSVGDLRFADGVMRLSPALCLCGRDQREAGISRRYVVFLSIIDFAQAWTPAKKAARLAKSMRHLAKRNQLSTIHPRPYAKRFVDFVESRVLVAARSTHSNSANSD